jgi:NAD(P) transhydrogenase subunit beta
LLTLLMAKAMNRSVSNVLFTNFGRPCQSTSIGDIKGSLKPVEAGDAGIFMRYASKVIIVPGYGLAAAQGQQKLYEFVKLLQAAGVDVKFAIHPVAGRMPGQMDVLLAEAGVPYDLIFQLEDINDDFADADVALVIGANDVVNPASPDLLRKMHAYWRAANYLSVGQIYLQDNPLLESRSSSNTSSRACSGIGARRRD